jgi:hypothetical protein
VEVSAYPLHEGASRQTAGVAAGWRGDVRGRAKSEEPATAGAADPARRGGRTRRPVARG